MSAHDVSRLPGWARDLLKSKTDEITYLKRDLDELKATVSAGPEDSTVFADPYGTERPLGSPAIEFRSAAAAFKVVFDPADGSLEIDSSRGRIAVYPYVSNSVKIKSELQ